MFPGNLPLLQGSCQISTEHFVKYNFLAVSSSPLTNFTYLTAMRKVHIVYKTGFFNYLNVRQVARVHSKDSIPDSHNAGDL